MLRINGSRKSVDFTQTSRRHGNLQSIHETEGRDDIETTTSRAHFDRHELAEENKHTKQQQRRGATNRINKLKLDGAFLTKLLLFVSAAVGFASFFAVHRAIAPLSPLLVPQTKKLRVDSERKDKKRRVQQVSSFENEVDADVQKKWSKCLFQIQCISPCMHN